MKGYMPFPNAELRIPDEYKEALEEFTQTRPAGGDRPHPDRAPFPRQVDMWFLAVCLGASDGASPDPRRRPGHKFNTAGVFENDPVRIELLELLAIAHTGSVDVLTRPREVIETANSFATVGLPVLVNILRDAGSPMDDLSEALEERLRPLLHADDH